jgi:AcrR family transcriptional regulator
MTARARKTTPRKRIGGEARRAQILKVASEMFARDGIEHTSMRKIAGKAGVTATLLYKHFADKEALLMAIGEGFFIKLAGYLDEATKGERDPVARLKARMRAYVTCGIENPREYHLTFMTALPGLKRGKDLRAFREKMRRGQSVPESEVTMGMRCFARLEAAVAAVVDARLTRIKDVALLSEAVWACGHGLVSLVITHGDFGWSEPKRLIGACVDMALNGLLKEQP